MRRLLPLLAVVALSWASCSHDAERNSPLDPELTSPVTLQAAVDDTAGVVNLTWTPADADGYAHYWVLRNRSLSTVVDTLAVLDDDAHLSHADTVGQDIEYVYRVSIVNRAGLEVASTPVTARPLSLPRIPAPSIDADSQNATATITWRPYAGPRFATYQVWRREGELVQPVSGLIAHVGDTSFTDTGLQGNVEYSYRVNVTTADDEIVDGAEASGGIHRLVDSWDLDYEAEGRLKETVKLYYEEGRIVALLTRPTNRSGSRVLTFDTAGNLLAEEELFSGGRLSSFKGTSTALLQDGLRYFAGVFGHNKSRALLARRAGSDQRAQRDLFVSAPWGDLVGDHALVESVLRLQAPAASRAVFDSARVVVDGSVVLRELFDTIPAHWSFTDGTFLDTGSRLRAGSSESWEGLVQLGELTGDLVVEVDVDIGGGGGGFEFGGDEYSRFRVRLTKESGISLRWIFTPPSGTDVASIDTTFFQQALGSEAPLHIVEELP